MTDRDEIADLLQRYREETAMPEGRRAENLTRAQQRWAEGATPQLDVTLPASTTTGVSVPLVVGLTAGLGAAAIAWALASGSDDTDAPPRRAAVEAAAPHRDEPRVLLPQPSEEPVETPSANDPAKGPELDTAVSPTSESKRPEPSKPPPPRKAMPPSDGASDLSAEVELLKRAQLAQAHGQPERALEILQEHRRRFPNGRMAEAREVARMTALCTVGRTDELERARRKFLARHAASAHAARVRSLCADAGQ